MDLPQRKLSRNHGSERPRKILFLDTETRVKATGNEEFHTLRIAWSAFYSAKRVNAWNALSWKWWRKTYPLCRYIHGAVGEKETLYIVGHNIFFDLQVIDFFYYLPRWSWELEFVYDMGLSYILVIRNGKRTIKVISTTNYFDFSLAKLGGELGIPKLEVEFGSVPLSELLTYCRRDVEILVAAMRKYISFIDEHDCGGFGMTKASQSFRAFRHRFMTPPIMVHTVEPVKWLEREAYHGGRTEAFQIGEIDGGPFLMLDVNSLYPYLMKHLYYPTKLIGFRNDLTPRRLMELIERYAVVGRVMINTDKPIYAVEIGGKICFPLGRFEATLCTAGILEAWKRGHLTSVIEAAVYERDYIFGSYVDYFYPLKVAARAAGNAVTERFTKIFLNSLYGKFGQTRPVTYSEPDPEALSYSRIRHIDLVSGQQGIEYHLFGRAVYQFGSEDTPTTATAIAAHVTEYGRLMLWNLIESIGPERVLYCDTDSVVIRESDLGRVHYPMNDKALGALSIKGRYKTLILNGAKDYVIDNKRIVKGVPRSARYLGNNSYEYWEFAGQAAHMSAGMDRGFIRRRIVKTVEPMYDKGTVGSDGRVTPFTLAFE